MARLSVRPSSATDSVQAYEPTVVGLTATPGAPIASRPAGNPPVAVTPVLPQRRSAFFEDRLSPSREQIAIKVHGFSTKLTVVFTFRFDLMCRSKWEVGSPNSQENYRFSWWAL